MEQLALVRKEVRRADLVRHRPAAAQPRRPMHDTMLRDRRARHTNVGHPVQAVTRKLARRRQGWRWLFTMYPPCLLLHSVDTCAHGHAHGLTEHGGREGKARAADGPIERIVRRRPVVTWPRAVEQPQQSPRRCVRQRLRPLASIERCAGAVARPRDGVLVCRYG